MAEEEEEELASEESTVDDESPDAAVATIQEMLDEAKGRGAESIRFIVETIGPVRRITRAGSCCRRAAGSRCAGCALVCS